MSRRFLGIYVRPVYVQNEGLGQVFDNLASLGAHAVCTDPSVSLPVSGGKGKRYPDLHIDGYRRVVARPVWGECEIQLETGLAFEPTEELYAGTPYTPRSGPDGADRDIPAQMVEAARERGMQAYLQISPCLPPGLRPEDAPIRIDGSRPAGPQVADSACPNSPAAQAYGLALVEDALRHYPDVDGLFTDWAEFRAYRLTDHFACFCPHCEERAGKLGFDWGGITRDVEAFWHALHSLDAGRLERASRMARSPSDLSWALARHPGCLQLMQFKAACITAFYRSVRERMDAVGKSDVTLSARGWPPPWNRSSGMDYAALSGVCDAVTPKLFTFDYSVLPRWYGETLKAWNPELREGQVLETLLAWMHLPDALKDRTFDMYQIPAPGELHPAHLASYADRVAEVVDQVSGLARVRPFAHAYLPLRQWREMVALVKASRADGMWVQMYGYLSDDKMAALREVWQA